MEADITLGQMIALVQSEIQKSYEFSNSVTQARGLGGVQMSVTDCEIDLPVSLNIVERTLDKKKLEESLNVMCHAELADARLYLPSFGQEVDQKINEKFDRNEAIDLSTLKARVSKIDRKPAASSTKSQKLETKRKTTVKKTIDDNAVSGHSLMIRSVADVAEVTDAQKFVTARLKLTYTASLRDRSV